MPCHVLKRELIANRKSPPVDERSIAAGLGLWVAWQRRSFGLLGYAASALVGSTIFWIWGSPWIGGKALTIASPLFRPTFC